MNRSADLRSGAGKAALKPPALQTLRAAVAAPYRASASGVRATSAPLWLSDGFNQGFRGSRREGVFGEFSPRTSRNIQHPTFNTQHPMNARSLAPFGVRCWMLDVGCFPLVQGFNARMVSGNSFHELGAPISDPAQGKRR